MGRLLNAILAIVGINLAMLLFLGVTESSQSSIFQAILNPEEWSNLSLIDYITVTLTGLGVGTVVAGFVTRNDLLVYLGIASTFIGFGTMIWSLYQALIGNPTIIALFGGNATSTGYAPLFMSFLFAPLLLGWIFLILEYGRGRD